MFSLSRRGPERSASKRCPRPVSLCGGQSGARPRRVACKALGVVACLLVACASEHSEAPMLVRVHVRDDRGEPVAGATIEVEGIAAISSAADGRAQVSLGSRGSPRTRVGVSCPAAYRPVEPRHLVRGASTRSAPLELAFTCRPKLRTLVVVARAPGGEGLVLRADGEPLGQIGADGTLHALLRRAPESDLRLMLDTAGRALLPQHPARELRVADRDELVVFDERLSTAKVRPAPRPQVAVSKPAAPPLPYAIRASR